MNTNKETRISRIVIHFLRNKYSIETEEKIQKWLIEERDSEEKEKCSLVFWNALGSKSDRTTYKALDRWQEKIGIQIETKKMNFHYLFRIAAVLLPLFIIAGVYYYYKEQLIEINVPYGEKRQLMLPDGSEVSLNSGTTLRYPKKFKKNIRIVTLIGEAYFKVLKDVSKPFIVKTKNLSIKVLGTRFNVRAYADDDRTITTLNSGKIEVNANSKTLGTLEPNQQLIFTNQTSNFVISEVSSNDTIGWTSGQLIFVNSSFEEILKILERRYNVLFIIDSKIIKNNEYYTIKFMKNDSLEQILNVLKEVIVNFSYQKQGNKILLRLI